MVRITRRDPKRLQRLPDRLFAREAEHRHPSPVYLDDARVGSANDRHRVRAGAERLGEPLLRRAEGASDPFAHVDLLEQYAIDERELGGPLGDALLQLFAESAKRRFLAQRRLGLLSFGDVDVNAEHTQRAAVGVADDASFAQYPARAG